MMSVFGCVCTQVHVCQGICVLGWVCARMRVSSGECVPGPLCACLRVCQEWPHSPPHGDRPGTSYRRHIPEAGLTQGCLGVLLFGGVIFFV